MQLRPEQLATHLAKTLAPIYVLHGDEPLLALEAGDAVRASARERGFAERETFEAGRGFDWSELRASLGSLSLFAAKKIVELRLPGGRPGTQGGEALEAYAAEPAPDTLLLVSLPRLDRATQNAPWFRALADAGVLIDIWPLERSKLAAWLAERLGRQQQRASREVLEFLAGRVEGNLLAAHQEVQKLALLAPAGELSLQAVQEAVADVARYDPQDAAEALLAGDAARYVRVIEGLRGEGEQPTFVLFTLSNILFALQAAHASGSAESAASQFRIFSRSLKSAFHAAASRYSPGAVERAIVAAAGIDRAIKGVATAEPWQGFIALGLKLAGGSKA
jgi:DNA polymerase III subunit delta